MVEQDSIVRITQILDALGLPRSSWYRPWVPASLRKRPGPVARPIPEPLVRLVITMAELYPWYGYKNGLAMPPGRLQGQEPPGVPGDGRVWAAA